MKLPLELDSCTIDLEEVAYIEYRRNVEDSYQVTKGQFDTLPLKDKLIVGTLKGGSRLVLDGEDAAVFASVFGKQVKEWVNEQILQWRKGYEERKDTT